MITTEFSNEFDALVQSYPTVAEFGKIDRVAFDEYEKSVFLTKAQEELVIELYNGKNPFNDSFEKTEEIRRYLGELTKQYSTSSKEEGGLSKDSYIFTLPDDLWFIVYEEVGVSDSKLGCNTDRTLLVVPTTHDEYNKVRNNPFRGQGKRRAIRLDLTDNKVEIISTYNVVQYLIRYIAKPSPIIVVDLPESLSINGISKKTECSLSPAIHRAILDRAVKLALASKGIVGK